MVDTYLVIGVAFSVEVGTEMITGCASPLHVVLQSPH